jgi:hypothetical protein
MVHVTSDPEEQSGTGEPRSAQGPTAAAERATPPVPADDQAGSEVARVARGAGHGSQPALSDALEPNRSGSGGSGGPVSEDALGEEEGSGAMSMEDMLGGGEERSG